MLSALLTDSPETAQRLDAEILPLPGATSSRTGAQTAAEAAQAAFDSCYQHLRDLLDRPGNATTDRARRRARLAR